MGVPFEHHIKERMRSMSKKSTEKELEQRLKALEAEYRELNHTVKALSEHETELEVTMNTLEESNNALRALLRQRDEDKRDIEKDILSNVRELVLPYLEKVKESPLDQKQLSCIRVLESNLSGILSPFSRRLSTKYASLTPTEIQIANLLKEGKNNREIAELMNISVRSVGSYRLHIRKKVGLRKRKEDLRSHLLSIQ